MKTNKANVIVNELSDMEADLVDLNSPNLDLEVGTNLLIL